MALDNLNGKRRRPSIGAVSALGANLGSYEHLKV